MKNKCTYILVGLMLFLTGCEDFLDKREDAGGLDETAIYASYESIRGFLDKVYSKLDTYNCMVSRDAGSYGRTYVGAMADEMGVVYNNTVFNKFFSGAWLLTGKSENVTEIGNGSLTPIGRAYPALRIVNRVIENIDKVPLTEEQRNEILGQAYFYRAWFYFQVIKRYGGMPIIDRVFAGGDDDLPRVTYHESSEWMVSDIDKAIAMLPDTWEAMHYGRPTKLAALAFKEMALLYDASPLMQNDLDAVVVKEYDKERAKKAAQAAWAAISYMKKNESLTGVRLATKEEYTNTFWFPDTELKRAEHIWMCRNIQGTTNRSMCIRAFWLYGDMTGQTGAESMAMSCPTLNAANMYERQGEDGIYYSIDDPRSGYQFDPEHAFVRRDPRFYNNILIPGDEWGTYKDGAPHYIRLWVGCSAYNQYLTNSNTNARELSGFMCRKFLWSEANQKHTGSTSGAVTYIGKIAQTVFIRVSQLYLDFAEASFEATGSATAKVEGCDMSAVEALNLIRKRIGVTNLPSDIVNDPVKFREAYRRERGVELMFEHHRWWDLRRWMVMHEVFKAPFPLKGVRFHPVGSYGDKAGNYTRPASFTYEEFEMTKEVRNFSNMRNYWYPLPQHDVDALRNLKQNPGW